LFRDVQGRVPVRTFVVCRLSEAGIRGGASPPWCQVAVAGLDQAVKAVA
jgi:hypothetical protein